MKYSLNLILGILVFLFIFNSVKSIYLSKKNFSQKINRVATVRARSNITPFIPKAQPKITITLNKMESIKYYVNPQSGDDNNDGLTEKSALKNIQKAIYLAMPGDNIILLPGIYLQDIVTSRDGGLGKPITIEGSRDAIIKGGGSAHVVEVNHDNIKLKGFTIDGHFTSDLNKKSYRDKLVYVTGQIPGKGVKNFSMFDMDIKNAGGECVRLRYLVTQSEIANNKISSCGVADFVFKDGGKNGEGIYVGTAPEQRNDKKNPTNDIDQSNSNWIHHNDFNTKGNECVDIKEGSSENIVEYNNCTGQIDPESGGLDSRGNNNIFRLNTIFDNLGAGIRLGGDTENDGIGNQIYENVIINNKAGGIKFQRNFQGKVCGNTMNNNEKGNSVGEFAKDYKPDIACN